MTTLISDKAKTEELAAYESFLENTSEAHETIFELKYDGGDIPEYLVQAIIRHLKDLCKLMDKVYQSNPQQIQSLANTIKPRFVLSLL